jgi:hypothetical protein
VRLPDAAEFIHGNIQDHATIRAALQNIDGVFHQVVVACFASRLQRRRSNMF